MAFLGRSVAQRLSVVLLGFAGILSGCYEDVAPACDLYVECWDYLNTQSGTGDPNVITTYRFDGACWNSPTTADECTATCQTDISCLVRSIEDQGLTPPANCVAGQPVDENGDPIRTHCPFRP